MRVAMVAIAQWITQEKLGVDVRMLLQVHDELIFEIKTDQVATYVPKIVGLMEAALDGKETHGVPLVAEVKVGENWFEMDELKS
jgi:DNA polymerase-1